LLARAADLITEEWWLDFLELEKNNHFIVIEVLIKEKISKLIYVDFRPLYCIPANFHSGGK
jgi:hypothetical protein